MLYTNYTYTYKRRFQEGTTMNTVVWWGDKIATSVPGQTWSCSRNRPFGRHPLHASLRHRGPGTPLHTERCWRLFPLVLTCAMGVTCTCWKGKERDIMRYYKLSSMIGTLWIAMNVAVVVPFFVAWGYKIRFTTRHLQGRRCEWRWNEKRLGQKQKR